MPPIPPEVLPSLPEFPTRPPEFAPIPPEVPQIPPDFLLLPPEMMASRQEAARKTPLKTGRTREFRGFWGGGLTIRLIHTSGASHFDVWPTSGLNPLRICGVWLHWENLVVNVISFHIREAIDHSL